MRSFTGSCAPQKPVLFVSETGMASNTILKGHMHRYEWSRMDLGYRGVRKRHGDERCRRVKPLFFGQKILRTRIRRKAVLNY